MKKSRLEIINDTIQKIQQHKTEMDCMICVYSTKQGEIAWIVNDGLSLTDAIGMLELAKITIITDEKQ